MNNAHIKNRPQRNVYYFLILIGVPDSVRGSGQPRNELVILTLNLLSYVTNIAPAFRPRFAVWGTNHSARA